MSPETDLSVFDEDNLRYKAAGIRVKPVERHPMVHEAFPSTRDADWVRTAPANIILAIFQDVYRVGLQVEGQRGPRPQIDPVIAAEEHRQILGESFSERQFHEAFKILVRHRRDSITAATNRIRRSDKKKIGLSRSRVYRLMMKHGDPTLDEMAMIAVAYGKAPSYFNEYRISKICSVLTKELVDSPETSAHLYRKLVA